MLAKQSHCLSHVLPLKGRWNYAGQGPTSPLLREETELLSSSPSSSALPPEESAAGGLRVGPALIQSTQQGRKPSTPAGPPLLGRSAGLPALCSGLPNKDAQSNRKGHVPTGIYLLCGSWLGAGYWAAELMHPSNPPWGQPLWCSAPLFNCTVGGSRFPGAQWVPSFTVPPKTRSLHPHMKFQPACRSLFSRQCQDLHKRHTGRHAGRWQAGG